MVAISSVRSTTSVSIAVTTGDPDIITGQFAINQGPKATVSSVSTLDSTTGISTFTFTKSHGFVAGSSFRILDNSNNKLGDFFVKTVVGVNTFSATTVVQLSNPTTVLSNGMAPATPTSDKEGENIGSRGLTFYDNETFNLGANVTTGTSVEISLPNAGIGTTSRFGLGSYIQVGDEVMRVKSATTSGSGNNELTVIRGALGTIQESHLSGEQVKKVKPIPIEFRRPSIIRASGHTFEYLGFGPGNYSTALPQVQVRTLTEREEFLTQSQERSCGTVVYTGMNNRGDFFIGNKKVSSATGQERTFDAPIPTVTGEDPSRLSVIFDEVIIKERLVVEGGKSRTILSQFDGPVTFNEVVKVNSAMTVNDLIKLNGNFEITNDANSHSRDTGSLITDGGIGIEKNLNVGENFNALGISTVNNLRVTGLSTFTGLMDIDGGAEIGNFKVGISTSNMLGSTSGNLIIDSAGGTTTIQDNLIVSGDFNSSGATNGNIRIGVTGDNEIDTSSGNLIIDSAGGLVQVTDNLAVTGAITSSDLTSGNLRIGVTGDNEIDTSSGGLTLDSASGTTTVDDNLNVTGDINLTGSFTGSSVSFSGNVSAAGGTFGNVTVGLADNQTVTTSSGKLILDAATNEVEINADIDHNGALNTSGNLVCGGTGTFSGDVIAFSSSDITLKENLSPITNALDKVGIITGYTYTWKSEAYHDTDHITIPGQADTGVIAQEIEALGLPGITTTRGSGVKAVRYERLVPILIEAIKELEARVKTLEG